MCKNTSPLSEKLEQALNDLEQATLDVDIVDLAEYKFSKDLPKPDQKKKPASNT